MLCQLNIYLSVVVTLVVGLSLLRVSHDYRNVHILFVVTLCNLIFQHC